MSKKIVVIGIDPSFRKKGFAACIFEVAELTMRKRMFEDFLSFLKWCEREAFESKEQGYEVFVGVENANKEHDKIYGLDLPAMKKKAFWFLNWHYVNGKIKRRRAPSPTAAINFLIKQVGIWATRGTSVGKVQAASQYTYETVLKNFGEERTFNISPSEKGAKIEDEKIFAGYVRGYGIKTLYDYKGLKSEQDFRDAAKICLFTYDKVKAKYWRTNIFR